MGSKFPGYKKIPKLHDVILADNESEEDNVNRNIDALAQLVPCLDDRSLSLVMRNTKGTMSGKLCK